MNAVRIATPGGAEASISLFGAHLVSWRTADGKERLFMSERSALDGSAAIRGGVPVIFPQFATRGAGMRHGFARSSTWRLAASGEGWAELVLSQQDLSAERAQAWPHPFELALRFELRDQALEMLFTVRNPGPQDFSFASALHTYYAVEDFTQAAVIGDGELHFSQALDEIHPSGRNLRLRTGAGTLLLEQEGFSEWVVWNPGADGAAALSDMADDEWRRFVCIEPARVDQRLLPAGATWTGRHTISLIP